MFFELREAFDVGTSEMEMATLARLSAEMTQLENNPVKCTCILRTLGTIPSNEEDTFAEMDPRVIQAGSRCVWTAALEALHRVASQHIVIESKL